MILVWSSVYTYRIIYIYTYSINSIRRPVLPYIAPVVKSRVMLECWTEIKGLVGPPFQPPQPQRCDLEVGSKFHESWQCKRCKTRNDGSYNHYDLHGGSSKPQEYPHLARDLPREEWISEGFVLLIPQSLALGWSPCGCDNGVYPPKWKSMWENHDRSMDFRDTLFSDKSK